MDTEFAFLCDATTIDREGKVNVLGIFDTLSGEQFPLQTFRIMLLISLVGEKTEGGNHDLKVKLVSPDGKELVAPMQMKFDIPPGGGKARIVSELNSISFESPGEYAFKVVVDEKPVRDVVLHLVKLPSPVTSIGALAQKKSAKKSAGTKKSSK